MKKKLVFLACSLICMFLLCSCSGTTTDDYGGYTTSDLETVSMNMAQSLVSLTEDQIPLYVEYYEEMAASDDDEDYAITATLLSDWEETCPMVGEFTGFGEFTVDKTGKTLTTTLIVQFSERNAKLVYVYNTYNMEITSINIEPVYTMGETMGKAALNTVMGILTVFVILVLISLVIYAFRIIPYFENKLKNKDTSSESGLVENHLEQMADAYSQKASDEELVAVIAAAIAAATGTTTDDFVVRSIRRRS